MKIIFCVHDRKTNSCALCKEAAIIEEFERWFATVFLRDQSMFALYPQDYDIYSVTALDDETMTIQSSHPPKLICSVDELFDIFKIARPNLARSSDEA